MIRINLLPFRAARKIENIRRQVSIFALAFIIIAGGMFYYNMTLKKEINQLNSKVEAVKKEVAKVEKQAKKVDEIKRELDKLNQKIEIITNLEKKRQEPVRLLASMTTMVAEKTNLSTDTIENKDQKPNKRLWFTSFLANDDKINIQGIALDNKTVADFMTRLESSKLYSEVTLRTLKEKKMKNLRLKEFVIAFSKITEQKETEKK